MKKLNKIFSIVLTAAIMTSLLITSAIPVSAGTQAWSEDLKVPSTTGMVLDISGYTVQAFVQSPVDGDLYAAVAGNKIIKSTNGGRTWVKAADLTVPAVALVASNTVADDLFMVSAATFSRSMNGGTTWSTVAGSPAGNFTALDVATFGGRYIAVVGVNNAAVGVYFWDSNDVFNNFTAVGTTVFGEAVAAVKMAPTFTVDRAVVAVGSTNTKVNLNGGAWGAAFASVVLGGTVADIAFPADFNAVTSPVFFVTNGIAAVRVIGGAVTSTLTSIDSTYSWTNLDVSGAFNAGTARIILGDAVGNVAMSKTSGFAFKAVDLRSAQATPVLVLLDKDYATNMKAYALNAGEALNVSIDDMTFFNQWSLVNETGKFVNIDIASNGDIAAVTDVSTGWRFFGGTWERVITGIPGSGQKVFYSPNYATDKTVYGAWMGTSNELMVSYNNGNSFADMLSEPGSFIGGSNNIYSVFVVDMNTVIVGSDAGIITKNTSPFFWTEASVFGAGYNVTDIKKASNGDLLAVATTGALTKVAKSTDVGATWTVLKTDGTGIIGDGAAQAFVAPANDYATSGNIFVAVDAALYRYPVAAATSATNWQTVITAGTTPTTGLVAAPGAGNADEGNGVVYVSTTNATADRVRGKMNVSDALVDFDGTTLTGTIAQLLVTADAAGNKLWALSSNGTLFNYVDTMAKGIANVAASKIVSTTSIFLGIVTTTNTATISWDAMTNATGYSYAVNTTKQTNFYTGTITGTTGATVTTANLTGLDADTTYYVSVWANNPVTSFMGNSSFTTVVGTPTPAMNLAPAAGAIDVPVKPTFDWADVPGGLSYEVWIDTKTDFSTAQKFTTPISAYAFTGTLANNTAYYWQVRAVTGTGTSGWVTSVFTTVAAAPPVVTVTSTTPASTSIVLTVPTTETPSYIWIIIGVGGLLTILVIVLIVRTRRVV